MQLALVTRYFGIRQVRRAFATGTCFARAAALYIRATLRQQARAVPVFKRFRTWPEKVLVVSKGVFGIAMGHSVFLITPQCQRLLKQRGPRVVDVRMNSALVHHEPVRRQNIVPKFSAHLGLAWLKRVAKFYQDIIPLVGTFCAEGSTIQPTRVRICYGYDLAVL